MILSVMKSLFIILCVAPLAPNSIPFGFLARMRIELLVVEHWLSFSVQEVYESLFNKDLTEVS